MFKFIVSSSKKSNWYNENKKEVCFIGRSNVGKSSLINSIANHNTLAKTSQTPGRTQLINYFADGESWIIDLPGYGFAKMPQKVKQEMTEMINEYLTQREQLIKVFLLVDSKVGPTNKDIEVMDFLSTIGREFMIVCTKMDKTNQSERHKTKTLLKQYTNDFIFVSSKKGNNISKLKKIIHSYFK